MTKGFKVKTVLWSDGNTVAINLPASLALAESEETERAIPKVTHTLGHNPSDSTMRTLYDVWNPKCF